MLDRILVRGDGLTLVDPCLPQQCVWLDIEMFRAGISGECMSQTVMREWKKDPHHVELTQSPRAFSWKLSADACAMMVGRSFPDVVDENRW